MAEVKCTGEAMLATQCPNDAKWVNQNGVTVCDYHKLMLGAFTWASRNKRKWELLGEEVIITE